MRSGQILDNLRILTRFIDEVDTKTWEKGAEDGFKS